MEHIDIILKNKNELFSDISKCRNDSDLGKVLIKIKALINDADNFVVTPSKKWWILILTIVTYFMVFIFLEMNSYSNFAIVCSIVSFAFLIYFYFYKIRPNRNMINELSKAIYYAKLRNLYDIEPSYNLNYSNLVTKFSDFKRGDEGRKIIDQHKGVFNNKMPFQMYTFKYVEVTTRTNSKGETETERTTCYRYGIICNSSLISSIYLSTGWNFSKIFGRKCWHPTAPNFNKIWSIFKGEDFLLAKFFTPSVVLEFVDFAKFVPEGTIIEVTDSELCMSFNDEDLFSFKPKYKMSDFKRFNSFIINYKNDRFDNVCENLYSLFNEKEIDNG